MTSFEQPDAGILVEHLLPSLLGANHSLSQEVQERTLFFGELGTALEALHGRLTVISSPPRAAREDSQYPWLWRYVSHFSVGSDTRAVQHAKLWAFHWKVDDEELLELHVSSTNLTASAFKGQLQAGWQVTLPLGDRANQNTRRTWGELVPFLEALGNSAGEVAATRIQRLATLLGRVECPADVTFIASIPGQRSAARQLTQFEPFELHVLTPTIGEWNDRTLSAWSADVGVVPGKIHLKWIAEAHPWAATSGWALSKAASEKLESSGVQLECLPKEARFTEQHRDADARWSHAKLYLLRSRRKRRLLVTSANWSVAAWGAGRTSPRNFELGVVFESEWTDLEALGEPFDPPYTVPFCVDRADEEERDSALEWAEASWDGMCILLHARSTDSITPITALVTFMGSSEEGTSLADGGATMPWNDPERTPLTARFTQGSETLEVDILDLRPPTEFAKTPLPEVDPAIAKALREAFLLQRYGGPVVDPESIPGLGGEQRPPGVAAPAADYTVQAWIDARAAFNVVDQWRAALEEAAAEPLLLDRVRMDGEELRALFARREGPAAGLVVEELGWRLDEEA
ncbi:hypothetical protein [Pyxidicoccus sp. MSG2]|uniref:hypothetical protein n=1 Tax=Pyxidicoccus sp. MSG2 TaxID=2996790 RepID=UPI002270DD14|nr:hypothetical protein [Pyxidicoccus sp. MSG2]MCY1016080.1 hypothetical protein [Pyxidicoccus sp. MSG2]